MTDRAGLEAEEAMAAADPGPLSASTTGSSLHRPADSHHGSEVSRPTSNPVLIIGAMAACVVVSHALARATLPILLPAIETELLSNRQQSGFLGSANFVAYLVGVALVTVIAGRVEPVRLLVAGLASAVLGFVLLSVAGGLITLAAGQALTGLGGAGIWMSAPAIATGAAPVNRRGTVMGLMSSTMGLGILLVGQGTNLMRAVYDDSELWRPMWVAAAIFTGLMAAIVVLLIRVPATEAIAGGVSIERLRTVPRWMVLSVGYWLFGMVSSSFLAFFGLLLKDQDFSSNHITNLFSVLGLAAVVGAVSLGRVSDRIGRRPVLTGSMVAMSAAAGLALIGREPFAAMAIATFGAASFTFPVLTVTYLRDHLEDRAFSNALGALTLVYGTSLIVSPSVAGTVADTTLGLEAVFVGFAAIAALAAAVIWFLPRTEAVTGKKTLDSGSPRPAGVER